jgi:hypothetical protein
LLNFNLDIYGFLDSIITVLKANGNPEITFASGGQMLHGALFEKTAPLDPQQKLLIKGGHSLQPGRISMQTMTAFGSFKVRRLKRSLKASIPILCENYNELYSIRHFDAFVADSIQLKKPYRWPKA